MRKRSICVTRQQHIRLDNALPGRWQPLSSTLRKPTPVCACATVEHRGWCRRRMHCVTTPPGAGPHRPASDTAAHVHGDTQTVDDAAQCAAVARSAHGQPPAWRWVAVAHPRPAPAQGRTRPPLHQRILLLHLLHDRASCGRLGYFVASPCFKTTLSSSAAASRWLSRWVSCSSSHNRLASLTCRLR